jgi:hypothetical protein
MRFYVAYKHLGEDETKLREILEDIADQIKSSGHSSFIYFRDIQKWNSKSLHLSPKQLIMKGFNKLQKCDALLIIVGSKEKSEGMLLEIGYAKALRKKILLAIDKKLDINELRFVRGISDYTVTYSDVKNLKIKIRTLLNKVQ